MTDEPEKSYSFRVRKWLEDKYGKENVHDNYYLKDSYRFVDYYVEGDLVDFAIEVENDFEAVLKGVGQSIIYSGELDCVPVVVLPPGHKEEPEFSYLNRMVKVIELDV